MDLSSHPDWWSGWLGVLIGGVIGAVVGSGIPLGWSAWQRSRERKGEVRGMMVELRVADMHMTTFVEDEHTAPLFRIPLSMFHRALPKLIGDGTLSLNEIGLLVEYVDRAEELNRGLDYSTQASMNPSSIQSHLQTHSNRQKARAILHEKLERHENQSLFDGAFAALSDLEESVTRRVWRWICDRWEYGALEPS